MKITATKDDLLRGLTIVSAAINPKATHAHMRDVLIAVGDDIVLTVNGIDTGVRTVIDGMIVDEGTREVEAQFLINVIKKMPDGDIKLEADENTLIVKGGKAKFKMPCKSGEDFPMLPETDGTTHFTLNGDEFKDLVKQIGFSASPGTDRSAMKALEGITFSVKDRTLNAYTLDGMRISMRNIVIDDNVEMTAIVPALNIKKIANITSDGEIHFYLNDKYMTVEFDNTTIVVRLVEGKPVDISRFTSMENCLSVRADREELMATLDRTTLMCKEGEKKPIICDFANNKISIHIASTQGSMNEEINAEIMGDGLRIGMNPRYVLEALQAIDDKIVTLHMSNAKSPIFIKDDENTYLYLILPVTIQEA